MRGNLLMVLVGLVFATVAVTGLAVMTGRDPAGQVPLQARVTLHDFRLPAGFGLDPQAVAETLVERMLARIEDDIALRMMLDQNQNEAMRDVAIPRLVNAGVIRRLFEEMEGVGEVIAMADVRTLAEVEVRATQGLSGVSLLVPGILRAETAEGAPLAVEMLDGGRTAVALPDGTNGLVLWLDRPVAGLTPADMRLGAAGGVRGEVRLFARQTGWNGALLQVLPWARWLVGAVLALVAVLAAALAGVGAVGMLGRLRGA